MSGNTLFIIRDKHYSGNKKNHGMDIFMGWKYSGNKEIQETKPSQTPKQKLIGWLQHNLRGIPLGNLTSNWRDGKKIGATVNGVAPGLCPDG